MKTWVDRGSGRGWEQQGVDWENDRPIVVWHKTRDYVVFKIPGGQHWASILEPSVSHPGNYMVCRLVEDKGSTLVVEELFSMPLSQRGRDAAR